jgi:hypothetical protein
VTYSESWSCTPTVVFSTSVIDSMAENYSVSNVRIDQSQALLRVVELRAGSARYDGLALSFGPRFSNNSEAPSSSAINEGYLVLTLDQLRELDSDPERQDRYIRHQLRFPEAGRLNILFANVALKPGERLLPKDIGYLNDLLLWEKNHVYVVPTLTFPDGLAPQLRLDEYEPFVRDLLATKKGTVSGRLRIGITIPGFYGRGSLDQLLRLYGTESVSPTFVAVDYQNSRVGKLSIQQKVSYIHRHFRTEEGTEQYFVYALRAKGRKRGECPAPAEDLASFLAGVNALGTPHNLAPGGGAYPFSWQALIGLRRDLHTYDRVVGTPAIRSAFLNFIKGSTTVPPPNFNALATPEDQKFLVHLRNFNRRMLNLEGSAVANEVRTSDASALKRRLAGKPSLEIAKRAVAS